MRLYPILFTVLLLCLAACSGGKKSRTEKIKLTLVSEGPLFSGPNMAKCVWKPSVAGKVTSVRFTSVSLASVDTSLADLAGNFVFQLAAADSDMKKIAFFNGNASSGPVNLRIAEEQKDLESFFNGKEITLVLDYDLIPEEYSGNLSFSLEFDAEITTE
jgi:hypothetical protein